MSVTLESLDILDKYPDIYKTSNDKHILGKDFEKVLYYSDYNILGFLNGYMFCNCGGYISKNTLDGVEISKVLLECDHGSFFESDQYFYTWKDNTITQIDENLNINWNYIFEDYIQSVKIDVYGSIYVIFENGRTIQKISSSGSFVMFIGDSDDVTKKCKLYDLYITPGGRYIYVLGSQFYGYNNSVDSFIDCYDIKKMNRINRQIFTHSTNVKAYDELYEYTKLILKGDFYYIYAKEYIMKINIKGIEIWKYTLAYNSITNEFNQIGIVEYDDNSYEEYLYFCEDLYSTNGYRFGKLYTNGNLEWLIAMDENTQDSKFKMCVYQNKIYTCNKSNIKEKKSFMLSIDNNKTLFQIRNGKLLSIVESNEELYSSSNYEGIKLIGSTVKDSVQKTINVPLMHNNGHIIDNDENALFITIKNPNYNDEYNHNTFELLHSEYSNSPKDISILGSTNKKAIKTLLGSVIKTKYPYSGDTISQSLSTIKNKNLSTSKGVTVNRNNNIYIRTKLLMADKYMYKECIVAKNDLHISTKLKNYHIIRKARTAYRYLLSKYTDINILIEWLVQNRLEDTVLPKYVDELRHHTASMIQSMQMAGVPMLYDVQPYKKNEYTFNNYKYINQTYGTQIFMCNNLPFNKRDDNPQRIYTDSIPNLVAKKKMRPVILFLNGRAIKWTDCTVIKDWSHTYIIIRNTNTTENNLECIIFPCNIRYGEDNNVLDSALNIEHMYFNRDGLLTEDIKDVSFRIETIDSNINGNTQYDSNNIKIPTECDQITSDKNILVFENGKLFSDSRFYISDRGKNIFKYDTSERNIKNAVFKTFYYTKANNYLGLLLKVPNQKLIEDNIINNQTLTLDKFNSVFDFKLYRSKPYNINIAEAVSYIMSYDMSLLIQYYKSMSNIKSYILTGEDIVKRIANDRKPGFLLLPRNRRNNLDDYIMVFVDDELYEYNYQIEYYGKEFSIPVFNHIQKESIVEILHFYNVNNNVRTLTVHEGEDDYISEDFRYDNFLLFGNALSELNGVEQDEEIHIAYNLDYSYKNNYNSNKYISTSIKLNDRNYYNKKLNIVSKRQFRYMYYNILEDKNSFNLAPSFKYCQIKNHYMVFVNKRKLTFQEFDINIAVGETTREWNFITTQSILHEGDRIEVFYLPDGYEEINVVNENSKGYGEICINTDELDYPFDKDLFLIFVNNKKINYNSLENISNNRIRIKNKDGVLDNVTVIKLLHPDLLLSKLFSYSDSWSNSIDSLNSKEYEQLLLTCTK